MFEKEANKDYMDNLRGKLEVNNESRLEEQFEDTFIRGAICGYKKANEWHFVKDGDLPKKTGEYLVYKISGYGSKSIDLIQYNVSRHFWCVDCQNEVIAWKEIVFPELKESK